MYGIKNILYFLDTSKFDSDEEDSTPVFSSSFIPKQTETLSSKTAVTKKGKCLKFTSYIYYFTCFSKFNALDN